MKTIIAKPNENPKQVVKTIGDMTNYWTKHGSFNLKLYEQISKLRSN